VNAPGGATALAPALAAAPIVAIGVEVPPMSDTGAPLTYGLRDAEALRGLLVMDAGRVQIARGGRTWELSGRRRGLSWFGVALEPGAEHADAAYYPHLGTGGTIAFEAQRYELRRLLFGDGWRLRDEDRRPVARMAKRRAPKRQDPLRLPRFTIELEPRARTEADLWLLLLIAAWAILTEPDLPCY
jgi:hypothetical protein